MLNQFFPNDAINCKRAELPLIIDHGPNIIKRESSRYGKFNTNTWKTILKIKILERVKIFMWQMLHKKLPTKESCSNWIRIPTKCNYCNHPTENILHIVRDCTYSNKLCKCALKQARSATFYWCKLKDWVSLNLSEDLSSNLPLDWNSC